MRSPVALLILVAALASVGLGAGCAPEDPYSRDQQRTSQRLDEQLRREQARGDELAPPAPAGDTAPAYAGSAATRAPEGVLRAFCAQWANWSYRTIERQQRRLAELSTARLAHDLAPSASQRALDTTLERDRFAVRGQIVAVDLRAGASRRSAICVTREEDLDGGRDPLGDGTHRVYLAHLERHPDGWVIAQWQPLP